MMGGKGLYGVAPGRLSQTKGKRLEVGALQRLGTRMFL